MRDPVVSFVVPCYKLAHLLPECVNSILAQSYADFEVLIMDDASPDNTPEVAQSFHDPRVKHIRNDPNLGSLRNYNKGLTLARGRYVWLISADDRLRRPYILQRYVDLLEKNPSVGYAYCAGVGLRDGSETGVLEYAAYGRRDEIINGHTFLKKLLNRNIVLAPSGLVRRECYERISLFPLDEGMMYTGDWYLWCVFALHHDVAYFAEPMVCYRQHELSMTTALSQKSVETMIAGTIAVPWMIKRKADEAGFLQVSRACLLALGQIYGKGVATERFGLSRPPLTLEQFEESLCKNTSSEAERDCVRTAAYAAMGSAYYWQADYSLAKQFYNAALDRDPWMIDVRIKKLFISFGRIGRYLRKRISR